MIEEPPLLTMARAFERPKPKQIEAFRGVPTSFICDAMGGTGALDWRIKPFGPLELLGVALTCHCGPADIMALSVAVQTCVPGDVLIAATDGFTGTAVIGDLMIGIAKNRGATGLVTDGLIRDLADIQALKFPVFAMGVSPNSPHSKGPGTVGLPVNCGGRTIASGDIVVGDRDGVVIVPRAMISDVLVSLKKVKGQEAELLERVRGGLTRLDSVTDLLNSKQVRYIER